MSQLNAVTGSILQSSHVQQAQSTEKARQLRRQHNQSRNIALRDDELEHQVESAEQLKPVEDDQGNQQQGKRRDDGRHQHQSAEEGEETVPHIDLTA